MPKQTKQLQITLADEVYYAIELEAKRLGLSKSGLGSTLIHLGVDQAFENGLLRIRKVLPQAEEMEAITE